MLKLHQKPILVGLSMLSITVCLFIFWKLLQSELEHYSDIFRNESAEILISTDTALQELLHSIVDIAHFISLDGQPSRSEFNHLTNIILKRNHGIQAIEWIPKVPHSERAAYEEVARGDGHPDFMFTEYNSDGKLAKADIRNEYYPVYYLAPFKGNEAALGFDLASSQKRLEAIQRARFNQQPTTSERITLRAIASILNDRTK